MSDEVQDRGEASGPRAARGDRPGRVDPRTIRRAVATVVAAMLVVVGVPLVVSMALPRTAPSPVAAGTVLTLRSPDGLPAGSFTAPAGWVLTAAPEASSATWIFDRGGARVTVRGSAGVRDVRRYAARIARAGSIVAGVTAHPDSSRGTATGNPSPRYALRDATGRTGQMIVVAHGARVVAVQVLSPPASPVQPDALVSSLAVTP